MNALVGQPLSELLLHKTVGSVQDVVDHFIWRVHDAHLLTRSLERLAEELLVQLFNDLLPAGIRLYGASAQANIGIQLRQLALLRRRFNAVFAKSFDHSLHGYGDRIAAGKFGTREQGLEHRQRDHVLGQHLNRFRFSDALVEGITQSF